MKALVPSKRKDAIKKGKPGAGFRQREKGQDVGTVTQKTKPKSENKKADKLLLESAKKGDLEKVRETLADGADVDAKDNDGWSALMWASEYGHTEVVQLLIDNKADVGAKSNVGWIALMYASRYGHTEVVELLRKAGATE